MMSSARDRTTRHDPKIPDCNPETKAEKKRNTTMKKIMFAAALAAAGLAFGIESANTVGFNTRNIAQNKWAMVAVQFQDVGTTSKNLLDFIDNSQLTAVTTVNMDTAPKLMVFNNGGYNIYYYLSDAFDQETFDVDFEPYMEEFEQLIENEDEEAAEELYDSIANLPKYHLTSWADGNGVIVSSVNVDVGDSVWFYDVNDAAGVTVSGEVNGTSSFAMPCAKNYNMVANPWPTPLALENISFGTTATAANMDNAARLMVYDTVAGGYTMYYYLADAFDQATFDVDFEPYMEEFEQLIENEDEEAAEELYDSIANQPKYHVPGWADVNGVVAGVTGTIADVGCGLWIYLPTAADTVTFTK